MEHKNAWRTYTKEQTEELEALSVRYRAFLDAGKTERECVKAAVRLARASGYVSLEEAVASGKTLAAGDKVYAVFMEKDIALFHIGEKPFAQGMRILGAHIDSPRLDLKPNPLYEDAELAYLDTHYYGGVKKYQWVTIPLAIHGVVAKKDGSVLEVCIGEKEDDPVVFVSDLLIHLAGEQLEKKARVVIEGENLDLLVGSRPVADGNEEGKEKGKEKDAVKANILAILKEQYGIEEEDFLSAELEIVPVGKARDCGLDRSMIMAYGQDDRVCAYTSMEALLAAGTQEYTCCCLLVDKEEIGSVAYDPLYASYFEKRNSAYFGKGMVLCKYTGSRGKSGSNDANAEYVAAVRAALEKHHVAYQTAELGKVDVGGGGTIAYISALYGMQVIDSGVAVMNMHAPMEVTSKADVYEAEKGYEAFLKEA